MVYQYIAERKTKVIGIRKVVGASIAGIITMLSSVAGGVSYKISPDITIFLISGVVFFLIPWITISFEPFRAANKNPVDTLKR